MGFKLLHYTNKRMVNMSDFIISGVLYTTGGASTACNYAMKKNKIVMDIFKD